MHPIDTLGSSGMAPSLAASDAWRRQLTETEIAALERATEMAFGPPPCLGFRPARLPGPRTDATIRLDGRTRLEHGPGVVRLSEPCPSIISQAIHCGGCSGVFSVNLGTPIYQTSASGEVLGEGQGRNRHRRGADLRQRPENLVISATHRCASHRRATLHTDKCDLLSPCCALQQRRSRAASPKSFPAVTIHNEMARRRLPICCANFTSRSGACAPAGERR